MLLDRKGGRKRLASFHTEIRPAGNWDVTPSRDRECCQRFPNSFPTTLEAARIVDYAE